MTIGATGGLDTEAERADRRAADEVLAARLEEIGLAAFLDRWLANPLFAGLDEATMRTPVRHYSSGMRTRLGFAIYSVLTPEILLIDEVLAVGDAAFRRRSSERLQKIASEARCVVIASHNLPFLKDNCDQVLWMHQGRVKALGDPADVVAEYAAFMASR